MSQATVAVIVFLLVYALIVSDKIHRTIAALAGAAAVIALGVLDQEQAIRAIDFNTIGLLTGMMIIVNITRRTGLFEYISIKAVKWAKGSPWMILVSLSTVTAIASAFLDNVTTVLLLAPITINVALELRVNPVPFLLAEIFASNIGGTATLIGDPPNIMIGSATGLTFTQFILNLTPVIIVIFVATIAALWFIFGRKMRADRDAMEKVMQLDESQSIKDPVLLRKSLLVLGLVILGFFLHARLGFETASVAMMGAALLLLIGRIKVESILNEVEWTTLFFFIGLFVVVGGLNVTGVLQWLANEMMRITGGDPFITAMAILWISAIASAFVDNIPFVATMIPIIAALEQAGGSVEAYWWALSLGACLGGNGTLIGASANVVVAGLAEQRGFRISFNKYLVYGMPLMLLSIVIAAGYVYLRYLA